MSHGKIYTSGKMQLLNSKNFDCAKHFKQECQGLQLDGAAGCVGSFACLKWYCENKIPHKGGSCPQDSAKNPFVCGTPLVVLNAKASGMVFFQGK